MKKAKDNFSKQAELYQKFRPGYPEALIDTLCDQVPERNPAWDCATGNGQSYWDGERKYIDERYATIPFPFDEFQLPEFEMKYNWTSEQLTGYLASWSAVAHYQRKNRTNPLELIKTSVEKFFNARKQVEVRFEIMGRYGIRQVAR